jgi:hypothetical protein
MKHGVQLTVLAVAMGIFAFPAQAAVITVAAGEVAVNAGNGICSLREAMRNAEADSDSSSGDCSAGSGADTIVLAAGSTYTLSDAYAQVELGTGDTNTGLPGIRSTLTINGNGATIQRDPGLFSGTACGGAGAEFRILFVPSDGNLTLNNLTLQNGCGTTGGGGAIFNHGTLALDLVTLRNNETMVSGGAIHNNGSLTLMRSTFSDNSNSFAAGGGIVNRGTLQISQSTLSGNTSQGAGGGIDTESFSGTKALANSTLSGNQSEGLGGAIRTGGGTITLTNVTIAQNTGTRFAAAPGYGSGIYRQGGTATLTNTLLAQQVNGANCGGSFGGGNNLADDATCSVAAITATPLIGGLAANGGPTKTHALLSGSPAIDAGNNTAAASFTTDQRGTGYLRVINATVDIGAFEFGNIGASMAIPSLSEWGMILLSSLLALGTVFNLRRQRM